MNITLKTVLDYTSPDTKIILYLHGKQVSENVRVSAFPFSSQANQYGDYPVKEIKPTDFMEMAIHLTEI